MSRAQGLGLYVGVKGPVSAIIVHVLSVSDSSRSTSRSTDHWWQQPHNHSHDRQNLENHDRKNSNAKHHVGI